MSIIQAMIAAAAVQLPEFVAANVFTGNTPDVVFNVPAGNTAGDLLVVIGVNRGNDVANGGPPGFTERRNSDSPGGAVYSKVSAGTETAADYEWDGSSQTASAVCITRAASYGAAGGGTNAFVGSYTFPAGGGLTIAACLNRANAAQPTAPAGWTVISQGTTSGSGPRGYCIAYAEQGAGASGTKSFGGGTDEPNTTWVHLPAD